MTSLAPLPSDIGVCRPRPCVRGKFIFAGDEKLYIRGVTYGTFQSGEDGNPFPSQDRVERDFSSMAEAGINCLRTYTVPPVRVLDAAARHGMYVLIGLPWEQHITFLDDSRRVSSIEARVREGVRACAGHPAVLGYAVGNEIPAPIIRWYGHRKVERFVKRLYKAAKSEDPGALVTYVNYPSTEYLRLPFVDFVSFNVYLEDQNRYDDYLAHLQNLAGDRPLVMAELGLDSRRNSEETQARSLEWMVRMAFAAGCAGTFVFTWTDEWYRGEQDINDWDFGLTRRNRSPKPALEAVRRAYAEVPFPSGLNWPSISVVVCSYNGARTIRDCCEGLRRLDYPSFEVIVVDDGSTDDTAVIAQEYGFRVISTENQGLSAARNTGMRAATGEIIAYIDDDAYPDPHWLTYLAATFMTTDYVGVGGPNIPPAGDGCIAECVANAPGGPVHVLLSDRVAEHIPGCNSAFRKASLEAVGGFDPRYRTAGDDVDVCWRLQAAGGTLGFSPAAMVWHHRRNSVRAYWRQQVGYGRAEALLEKKWPEKYNALGHLAWSGRLYGQGLTSMLGLKRERIYQGPKGSALFQFVEPQEGSTLWALPLMPEWYLLICVLTVQAAMGYLWRPKLLLLPLLVIAAFTPVAQACVSAAGASFPARAPSRAIRFGQYLLTAFFHMMQPLARLRGRLRHGLTPWRRHGRTRLVVPFSKTLSVWSERWRSAEAWLDSLEAALRQGGATVCPGGPYDRWDIEVRSGTLGAVRVLMTLEEHGSGRQMLRFRCWPRRSLVRVGLILYFAMLAAGAALGEAPSVAVVFGLTALFLALRKFYERAVAMSFVTAAVRALEGLGAHESVLVPAANEAPAVARAAAVGSASPLVQAARGGAGVGILRLMDERPKAVIIQTDLSSDNIDARSARAYGGKV